MGGGFACPECGRGIALRGLTPGREVVCPACLTLVEVPYLPRAQGKPTRPDRRQPAAGGGPPRRRSRATLRRRQVRRALAAAAVLVVAAATWWAVGAIGSKARSDRERLLIARIEASDRATAAGDPAAAWREMAAAVVQARRADPRNVARLDDLGARRDTLALADVRARLAALGRHEPDPAALEAAALVGRVAGDPALAPLADAVAAAVEVTTRRQVEADRARARAALDEGRGADAFAAAARMQEHAGRLAATDAAGRVPEDARALVATVVERFGVTLDPTSPGGPGPGPSSPGFAVEAFRAALVARGYLLPPADPAWTATWADHAPVRATCRVVESPAGLYLQSQNRSSQVDGQFALARDGQPPWQVRVYAPTRSPLPDLPAFIAGKLATAAHRDAEIERRLRDDARAAWLIQAARVFRGIPPPGGGRPVSRPAVAAPPGPGGS